MTASSSSRWRSPAWTSTPKALILGLLLASTAGAAEPGAAAGDQPLALLERMAARLKTRSVWSARYQQEYVPVGMTMGEETTGRLWLAWPDRAFFQQGDPVQRLTGLEGRHVRLVDLEVGSCENHVLTDEEWQRTPLVAVVDPASAVHSFTFLDRGPDRLALVPRKPGGVQRVEIVLGADDLPAEVVVVDPQGAVNRFHFTGWAPAAEPPPSGWLPTPPAGVTCTSGEGDSTVDPG